MNQYDESVTCLICQSFNGSTFVVVLSPSFLVVLNCLLLSKCCRLELRAGRIGNFYILYIKKKKNLLMILRVLATFLDPAPQICNVEYHLEYQVTSSFFVIKNYSFCLNFL